MSALKMQIQTSAYVQPLIPKQYTRSGVYQRRKISTPSVLITLDAKIAEVERKVEVQLVTALIEQIRLLRCEVEYMRNRLNEVA